VKHLQLVIAVLVVTASEGAARAEESKNIEDTGPVWSLTLSGGALVPIGVMRDSHQDALIAGVRLGIRAQVGIGVELAVDYSPLPRRESPDAMESDTKNYGTAALMPAWTLGHGVVRLQVAGGGGVAVERNGETVAVPVAIGQAAVHLHVTKGGGLVVMAGGTRTFQEREYQYAWGMGGLKLEF
jgi:hypothetical protein